MTEYITCPRCEAAQPEAQWFCGECGAALREGVTRPLTADERAMLEDRARLAVPTAEESRAQTGPGRESAHRSPLVTGLGVVLVLVLLAALVLGVSSLLASQRGGPPAPGMDSMFAQAEATPTDYTLVERGQMTKIGPGIVLTFTTAVVHAGSSPQMCPNSVGLSWVFDVENTNTVIANIVGDAVGLVDSTGRTYTTAQCGVKWGSTFGLLPVRPLVPSSGYVGIDIATLSAAATYLDLHMLISGRYYIFRTPFP